MTLVGGEPGIGKSTLLLQAAARLESRGHSTVLYASGEESPEQVQACAPAASRRRRRVACTLLGETNGSRPSSRPRPPSVKADGC
jgi:predicted ATP-dependent serine protease